MAERVGALFEAGVGRLPPVSHMIRTINTARPTMSQDCTFFGEQAGRLRSVVLDGFVHGDFAYLPSVRRANASFLLPMARYPLSEFWERCTHRSPAEMESDWACRLSLHRERAFLERRTE